MVALSRESFKRGWERDILSYCTVVLTALCVARTAGVDRCIVFARLWFSLGSRSLDHHVQDDNGGLAAFREAYFEKLIEACRR